MPLSEHGIADPTLEITHFSKLGAEITALKQRLCKVNSLATQGGPPSSDPSTGDGTYSLDQLILAKEDEITTYRAGDLSGALAEYKNIHQIP